MAVSLFASELRRAREARGWTRDQFAAEMNYSASAVEKTLRAYNPLVVHGMAQTEEYARAQLRSNDPEQTETRVAARMERQRELFDREKPTTVAVVLDESVLHRRVGDHQHKHDQLTHLTACPAAVQVVPAGAETCLGLDGAFELATVDGHDHAYAETPLRGFVLDDREVVSQARERWETLVAEALPLRQSRELILKAAEHGRHEVAQGEALNEQRWTVRRGRDSA